MKSFYLTKEFARQVKRSRLGDDSFAEAVDRAEAGTVDADLGGGLIKQRVARPGKGRSGGYRTVIAYRSGERAIFLHMVAKNEQANISPAELEELREFAKLLLKLSDEQLRELAETREWKEIERPADGEEGLP